MVVSNDASWNIHPLGSLSMTFQQSDRVQQTAMQIIIAKCGYNRHTKREIWYGPLEYGGASFRHLNVQQGIRQVTAFLRRWRQNLVTGQLLRCALAWTHMTAQVSQSILVDVHSAMPHLELKWIASLRQFLSTIDARSKLRTLVSFLCNECTIHIWWIIYSNPSSSNRLKSDAWITVGCTCRQWPYRTSQLMRVSNWILANETVTLPCSAVSHNVSEYTKTDRPIKNGFCGRRRTYCGATGKETYNTVGRMVTFEPRSASTTLRVSIRITACTPHEYQVSHLQKEAPAIYIHRSHHFVRRPTTQRARHRCSIPPNDRYVESKTAPMRTLCHTPPSHVRATFDQYIQTLDAQEINLLVGCPWTPFWCATRSHMESEPSATDQLDITLRVRSDGCSALKPAGEQPQAWAPLACQPQRCSELKAMPCCHGFCPSINSKNLRLCTIHGYES